MSDIERFITIWAGGMIPAKNDYYVRYDDHRAEVERVMADVVKLRIDLNSAQVAANQRRGEVDRLITERDEIHAEVQRLTQILNGRRATTDRVITERNEAQAEVERLKNTMFPWDTYDRLKNANEHLKEDVAQLTVDRDAAQAEVERLTRMLPPTAHTGLRNGPGEGSWSVFAGTVVEERDEARKEVERLNAEVKRLTSERDEAQADVEQLTQNLVAWKKDYQELEQERNRAWDLGEELNRELEGQKAANQRLLRECAEDIASAKAREEAATTELHETREKLEEVQVQYDEFAKATAKVIDQHQRERDHARQQVYRLQQAGADRPTDEDIWREAFISQLHDVLPNWATTADAALAEYRKRWPR